MESFNPMDDTEKVKEMLLKMLNWSGKSSSTNTKKMDRMKKLVKKGMYEIHRSVTPKSWFKDIWFILVEDKRPEVEQEVVFVVDESYVAPAEAGRSYYREFLKVGDYLEDKDKGEE